MMPSEYSSAAPDLPEVRAQQVGDDDPAAYTAARSGALASSLSFANCTDSYTPWKMRCTSAPASIRSAARRSAFGVVFAYLKAPTVSVTSAVYSGSAMSGVIDTRARGEVAENLAGRGRLRDDEVDVAEARVVVVMVDVEDERHAVEDLRIGPEPTLVRAVDRDENPLPRRPEAARGAGRRAA